MKFGSWKKLQTAAHLTKKILFVISDLNLETIIIIFLLHFFNIITLSLTHMLTIYRRAV